MPPNLSHLTKPPLGILHRKLWEEKRLDELCQAIFRYMQAELKIPVEWIQEYNELLVRQKHLK